MKIRIRLYHYHDLDLVSLYREGRISVSKAVKYTLNAFAQKRYVGLEVGCKKCEKTAKPVYMFNIMLDEKKDKDAIDLLNKIEKGFRNNFIKLLLREYLCFTLPECYTMKDMPYFCERQKGMWGKHEIVSAPAGRNINKKTAVMSEASEPFKKEFHLTEMDTCKVETNKQLSNGNSKGQEDLADETAGDEVELLDFFKNMII